MMRNIADAYRFLRSYGQHLPLALDALFKIPCRILRIRGSLRPDGTTVTLLYTGRRRRNLHYLMRTFFDRWAVVDEQRSTLLTFKAAVKRWASTCDVTIVDLGWPYNGLLNRNGDYLEIPDWVNMVVWLEDDWDRVVGAFRQTARNNDLRLIRRNNYRYVTTREREAIEHFYDEIYLPFVKQRHDSESIVAPRRHVIRRARRGALLQVMCRDRIVASGVVHREDDVLYFLWMGLPRQHHASAPEGAISALYYFGIRYAWESGCHAVDFTGTRAFLNDGAFRFKRKWGAMIEDSFSPSSILLKPDDNNRVATVFCERTPVVARGREGLEAILTFYETPPDQRNPRAIAKQLGCKGIDRVTVIEVTGDDEGVLDVDDPGTYKYRHVRTPLENFAGWYRRDRDAVATATGENRRWG